MHDRNEIITVEDLKNLMGELRGMARGILLAESNAHSVTPTALAISAIIRAKCPNVSWEDVQWKNRRHFFSVIQKAMRHALIDHARKRKAKGRNLLEYVGWNEEVLRNLAQGADQWPDLFIALHEAIKALQKKHRELAELIHLAYFARYTISEIADFLGPDANTGDQPNEKAIDRALKDARLFLKDYISKLIRRNEAGRDAGT
jgi:DNA-directed RNA polymerase specialized sigma24 family protein